MRKLIALILCISAFVFNACNNKKSVEKAAETVRTKTYRSITVINGTKSKYIAECSLTTENGVFIDHRKNSKLGNLIFKNFDSENAYKDEENFKIILIDRYGLKYEHKFSVNEEGNTDVLVSESDLVKQSGNLRKKLERKLNE